MIKLIPCKKCPNCGFYHDLTVTTCDECGESIRDVPAIMTDVKDIPGTKFGQIEIDAPLTVFVQKCPRCGALNFTSAPNEPVKRCYNCYKVSVASIVPTKYINEKSENADECAVEKSDRLTEIKKIEESQNDPNMGVEDIDDDDDDDGDNEVALWAGILKENIEKSVGSRSQDTKTSTVASKNTIQQPLTKTEDDIEDEDDEVDWSGLTGKKDEPKLSSIQKSRTTITLTAITYDQISFSIEADGRQYMLGRSANQKEFLDKDGRVGNEHCYIFYRDGYWYVRDNHSANGTAVNSRDIGLNGEHILNDGDELKLGHHPDSMAFRITI